MRVNLYLMDTRQPDFKGEKLASVELEVVPRGFYVIDGVQYQFAGQPAFQIITDKQFKCEPEATHRLTSVDLLVIPVDT